MKRFGIIVLVLVCASLTFITPAARAFKVLSLRKNVNKSGTYVIRVWNTAKISQDYSVTIGSWYRDKFGVNVYEADEKTKSCREWIELLLESFSLSPEEWKDIPFSIKIPRGLNVTHVAMVWIVSQSRGQGQIRVRKRIGIKVYADPRKPIRRGKITGMKYKERALEVVFENQGNVELKLEGWIQVGEEEKLNLSTAYILPGIEQVLKLEMPYAPEIRVIIDYGGRNLAGGVLK